MAPSVRTRKELTVYHIIDSINNDIRVATMLLDTLPEGTQASDRVEAHIANLYYDLREANTTNQAMQMGPHQILTESIPLGGDGFSLDFYEYR